MNFLCQHGSSVELRRRMSGEKAKRRHKKKEETNKTLDVEIPNIEHTSRNHHHELEHISRNQNLKIKHVTLNQINLTIPLVRNGGMVKLASGGKHIVETDYSMSLDSSQPEACCTIYGVVADVLLYFIWFYSKISIRHLHQSMSM